MSETSLGSRNILIDRLLTRMNDQSLPRAKTRALTYSEMMNSGRSRIDEITNERELELQRRESLLERDVNQLEQSLKISGDCFGAGCLATKKLLPTVGQRGREFCWGGRAAKAVAHRTVHQAENQTFLE